MTHKHIFKFTGWVWGLITGLASLLAYFGIEAKFMVEFFNSLTSKELAEYTLLTIAIFSFVCTFFMRREKTELSIETFILKDLANNKKDRECALWDYGKYGVSVVPTNDTWSEWISYENGNKGLVATVERPDLDYYNFGDEFYFFDLATGNKIQIPTGNKARTEKVGSYFRNGMVLRLMPTNT